MKSLHMLMLVSFFLSQVPTALSNEIKPVKAANAPVEKDTQKSKAKEGKKPHAESATISEDSDADEVKQALLKNFGKK